MGHAAQPRVCTWLLAALALVSLASGSNLVRLDTSSVTADVGDVATTVGWHGDTLHVFCPSAGQMHRYTVSAEGALGDHVTGFGDHLVNTTTFVSTAGDRFIAGGEYGACWISPPILGAAAVLCSSGESDRAALGYVEFVARDVDASRAWAAVVRKQGVKQYFLRRMDADGSIVGEVPYHGKKTKQLRGMACAASPAVCMTHSTHSCSKLHAYRYNALSTTFTLTSGDPIPDGAPCAVPTFEVESGHTFKSGRDIVACGASMFIDASMASSGAAADLIQFSLQDMYDGGVNGTVTGVLHAAYASNTRIGLGCTPDNRLVAVTDTTVHLLRVVDGTSVASTASIGLPTSTASVTSVATFESSLVFVDAAASAVHAFLRGPVVSMGPGLEGACWATGVVFDGAHRACRVDLSSLDDVAIELSATAAYTLAIANVDTSAATNIGGVAVTLPTGAIRFALTSLSYQADNARIRVSIHAASLDVSVLEFRLVVAFTKPSIVLPTLSGLSLPFAGKDFPSLLLGNAAGATADLVATVALAESASSWAQLKDPVTNAGVDSVTVTLAEGESIAITAVIQGFALGAHALPITVTSNDFTNPAVNMEWDVFVESAKMLAVFPTNAANSTQGWLWESEPLMPGQRGRTHRLSFVSLMSGELTVAVSTPAVPWLRLASDDPNVVLAQGSAQSIVFQFVHDEVPAEPLALGQHSTVLYATAFQTSSPAVRETREVVASFTATAGAIAPQKCDVRFLTHVGANVKSVADELRVGSPVVVTVLLRDRLGHPSAVTSKGQVHQQDVVVEATLQSQPFGKVWRPTLRRLDVDAARLDMVLELESRGKHVFRVFIQDHPVPINGDDEAVWSVRPRLCTTAANSTASTSGGACVCLPGFYAKQPLDAAQPECAECPEGHVHTTNGNAACSKCPPGTFVLSANVSCEPCPSGSVSGAGASKCTSCGTAAHTGQVPSPAKDECICSPGWQLGVGEAACVACGTGKVQPGYNADSCRSCLAGTFPNAHRTQCLPCPDDTMSEAAWGACVGCDPGFHVDTARRACRACPAGTANDQPNATSCPTCALGHIAAAEASPSCHPCAAGTYAVRAVECRPCGFNTVSGPHAGSCTACSPGTWSTDGVTCHGCPPGTFQSGPGRECDLCPAGTVSAAWNSTTCHACPARRVPNQGRTQCVACAPGTVALTNIACRPCETGTWNANPDAASCAKCDPGFVARTTGSAQCAACPSGFAAPSPGSAECEPCPANSFSTTGSAECTPCPGSGGADDASGATSSGVSCTGGAVTFLPGFWRPPALQSESVVPDTVFHRCPPGACKTDAKHGNVSCADGHTGPLCSVCQPDFAKSGSLCSRCWSQSASVAATVVAAVLLVGILVASVTRSTGHRSELMAVCRIFLNWVQLTSAIGTFALKAPALASDMLNLSAAADGVSLNAFFVQCAVGFTFYSLFISYCAFPFVSTALAALTCATAFGVHSLMSTSGLGHKRLRRKYVDYFKMAATVTIVVTYVKVSREIFSVFEVYAQPVGGAYFLRADMSVEAHTAQHVLAMLLGALMLLVYVFGVPTFAVLLLSKRKAKVLSGSKTFRRKYGFLFDGYDAERGWAWWESVVMLRKVLATAIAVFIDDSFLQVYAATILLTVALVAQAYVSPFTSDLHNNLELLSLVASQVTQMGSIMYWRFPQRGTLITVVLVGVNGVTALTFVLTMIVIGRRQVLTGKSLAASMLARWNVSKPRRKTRRASSTRHLADQRAWALHRAKDGLKGGDTSHLGNLLRGRRRKRRSSSRPGAVVASATGRGVPLQPLVEAQDADSVSTAVVEAHQQRHSLASDTSQPLASPTSVARASLHHKTLQEAQESLNLVVNPMFRRPPRRSRARASAIRGRRASRVARRRGSGDLASAGARVSFGPAASRDTE